MNEIIKKDESLDKLILQKKSVLESRLKLNGIDRNFEDYANDIIYAVSSSDDLKKCTPKSIVDASFQLAKAGLSIGGNIGHLVPRGGKCTFQIGFEGYALMLNRAVGIKMQRYEAVYEGDELKSEAEEISVNEDGSLKSIAKFSLKRGQNVGDKSKIKGAFAYIMPKDGNSYFLYLSKDEIDKKYKPEKTSSYFWGKWDELMYPKQVYKILARKLCRFYCQTSPEAIEILGEEENKEIKDIEGEKPTINTLNDVLSSGNEIQKLELEPENEIQEISQVEKNNANDLL